MVSAYFEDFALSTQLHHIARLPGLSWYSCVTLATLWQRDCGYLSPSSGRRISMFHVHTKLLQWSNIIHRRYRRAQKFVKSCQNILTFLPCQETFLQKKYTDRNRSTLGWRKKFVSRHIILSELFYTLTFKHFMNKRKEDCTLILDIKLI